MRFRGAGSRLGQNFLTDRSAVGRMVAALKPAPGDAVLEIGPGRGAMTGALIEAAGRITAVEIDDHLISVLRRKFDEERLVLIREDILRVDLASIGTGLVVAGNLPYNISKPIAMKLIVNRALIDRAVLMFQKEVADRLTAAVGGRSYGPLTVLAGQAYDIAPLFDLPPGAFRPRPKVTSTVTAWRSRTVNGLDERLEPDLRACLAACFARRRQTLRNNLRAARGSARAADELLTAAELDGSLRAEALPPAAFLRLARVWHTL
jgi:16S rRNA (adenine1518-N6/adenine1519-N6)-dimethyltransferase